MLGISRIVTCVLLVVVSATSATLCQKLSESNKSQIRLFFVGHERVGWGPLWIGMPLTDIEAQFGQSEEWISSSSCAGLTYQIPAVSERLSVGFLPSEDGPVVAWISVSISSPVPFETELPTLVRWLSIVRNGVAKEIPGLLYRPRRVSDTESLDHAPSYEIANHPGVRLNVVTDWVTLSIDRVQVENMLGVHLTRD